MSKGAALAYKPLGLAASVTGGLIAGMIVEQVWKRVIGEEDAPEATDANRGWGEIILAAAIQGAIFAVVKAIVDRGGATGLPPAHRRMARGRVGVHGNPVTRGAVLECWDELWAMSGVIIGGHPHHERKDGRLRSPGDRRR